MNELTGPAKEAGKPICHGARKFPGVKSNLRCTETVNNTVIDYGYRYTDGYVYIVIDVVAITRSISTSYTLLSMSVSSLLPIYYTILGPRGQEEGMGMLQV